MKFAAAILCSLALAVGTLPAAAADRTVHIFTGTYAFQFAPDYKFKERLTLDGGKRQVLSFTNGNRSIVISGSRYNADATEPLEAEAAYMAKRTADKATNVIYQNDETDNGRAGSHLVGYCVNQSCLYEASRAIGRKFWLNVEVACDGCSAENAKEVSDLAQALYRQLKQF